MLYNSIRPKRLSDMVGQEAITGTLTKKLESGNMTHSVLLVGVRGTGKTSTARILAKAVNCLSPVAGEPCCQCENCRAIESGSALDVVEFDAASNSHVADVKALLDSKDNVPMMKKKVYIIDEVHMLSKEASNSLLKVVEEPPKDVMIILCTTELSKVLPTIKSRCATFHFKAIDQITIASYLAEVCENTLKVQYELEALYVIAKAARGSMRDALSILEPLAEGRETLSLSKVNQSLGLMDEEFALQMLEKTFAKKADEVQDMLEQVLMSASSVDIVLDSMMETLTNLVSVKLAGTADNLANTQEYKELLVRMAEQAPIDGAIQLFDELKRVRQMLYKDSNPRLSVLVALLEFIFREEKADEISALRKELEELKVVVAMQKAQAVPLHTANPAPAKEEEQELIPSTEKTNVLEDDGFEPVENIPDFPVDIPEDIPEVTGEQPAEMDPFLASLMDMSDDIPDEVRAVLQRNNLQVGSVQRISVDSSELKPAAESAPEPLPKSEGMYNTNSAEEAVPKAEKEENVSVSEEAEMFEEMENKAFGFSNFFNFFS